MKSEKSQNYKNILTDTTLLRIFFFLGDKKKDIQRVTVELILINYFLSHIIKNMGYIVPKKNEVSLKKVANKRILVDCALELLNETEEDEEGVERTNAMMIMRRLVATAKYAEANRDATNAASILLSYTYGKPSVVADEEQEEMPEIVLRVNPKDKAQLEALAARHDLEHKEKDPVVVQIEGEDGELEYD